MLWLGIVVSFNASIITPAYSGFMYRDAGDFASGFSLISTTSVPPPPQLISKLYMCILLLKCLALSTESFICQF